MAKIAIILGTRPQIVKSAPVIKSFRKSSIDCSVVNTGQHYDYEMNKQFFEELALPEPSIDLGVGPGAPNEQIYKIVKGLEDNFKSNKPDLVIIPGDTNSALAAGIACSKLNIKIAHLESGCRSNDFEMSEEINRRILDHISAVLLCPTFHCAQNLRSELVLAQIIEVTGDTMYDSILQCSSSIKESKITSRFNLKPLSYVFMTLHRAENVDDPKALSSILKSLTDLDLPILFSIHPRTKQRLEQFHITIPQNVIVSGPLPYFDTLNMVEHSKFVITDSGGLQKEAFWLAKPSLITRTRTEWVELVDAGAAFLVGCRSDLISAAASSISRNFDYDTFNKARNLFGNGQASENVVRILKTYLKI